MRERDLQSMCRRALLLTVCMVSLWGQLTSASSHRSHIGIKLHVSSLLSFQGILPRASKACCCRLISSSTEEAED